MSNDTLNFLGTPLVHDGPGVSIIDIGVTWAFTFIAILFVALRFYLHQKFAKGISGITIDDWLTLASVVLLVACSACTTQGNLHGLGRSFQSVTLDDYIISNYWFFLVGPLNVFISLFARMAIAITLVRIFGQSKPWFRTYIIGWTIFMVVVGVLSLIVYLARLTPIQAQWDPTINFHANFNALVEEYIALGLEYQMIISDITFVFFPVMFIWKLQMAYSRKLALIGLMSVGLITFGSGLAKIVIATQLVQSTFYATQDAGVIIGLMSTIENSLAISMGCVPTLGHVKQLRFSWLSRVSESLTTLFGGLRSSRTASKGTGDRDVELGRYTHQISDDGKLPRATISTTRECSVVATQQPVKVKTVWTRQPGISALSNDSLETLNRTQSRK